MNARNRSRFTRTRSVSPTPSPSPRTRTKTKSHALHPVVYRTTSRLKDAKGPSPTSVTATSFDFRGADEEPYDSAASTKKRASSVGNFRRINGMNVETIPSQALLRGSVPVTLPKSPRRKELPVPVISMPPKSPGARRPLPEIPKTSTSSFKQRRILLVRQRKWKEERMEKTVQSKTARGSSDNNNNTDQRSTISGKEMFISSLDNDELEVSISNHLQKEGFDRSVMPEGGKRYELGELPIQAARKEHPNDLLSKGTRQILDDLPIQAARKSDLHDLKIQSTRKKLHELPIQAARNKRNEVPIQAARKKLHELPIQAARTDRTTNQFDEAELSSTEEEEVASNGSNAEEDWEDTYDDSMTIDTVSSLNTNNTYQSEDAFSARSWLPSALASPLHSKPSPASSSKMQVQKVAKPKFDGNVMLHPPMFVESKARRQKSFAEDEEEDAELFIATIAEHYEESDEILGMDMLNTKSSGLHALDITDIASNKSRETKGTFDDLNTRSTGLHVLDGTDVASNKSRETKSTSGDQNNDIPAIDSIASKDDKDPLSSRTCGDRASATALRRKRLQRYMKKKATTDTDEISLVNARTPAAEGIDGPLEPKSNMTAEGIDGPLEPKSNMSISTPKEIEAAIVEPLSKNDSPTKLKSKMSIDNPEKIEAATLKPVSRNSLISFSLSAFPLGKIHDGSDEKIDSDLQALIDQVDKRNHEDEQSIASQSLRSFSTLKSCFTVKPATRQEMETAIQQKKDRVNLIHHALTCTHPHPTIPEDESYEPCQEVKHCLALGVLIRHVQTCTFTDNSDGGLCEVPGCAKYKRVWTHYRRCVLRTFTKPETKTCKICGDVWRKYRLENSFENSYDIESSFEAMTMEEALGEALP